MIVTETVSADGDLAQEIKDETMSFCSADTSMT